MKERKRFILLEVLMNVAILLGLLAILAVTFALAGMATSLTGTIVHWLALDEVPGMKVLLRIVGPIRAEDARSWRAALNNLPSGPNRILVNLDAHLDRTIGARALDCTIIAHQKTAQVFRNRPTIFKGQTTESGAEWEVSNDVLGTRWAIPDITFSNSLHFQWGWAGSDPGTPPRPCVGFDLGDHPCRESRLRRGHHPAG